MITEMELFVSGDLIPSDACLWALLKSEVSKIHKTNLDAAVYIKTLEDQ